MQIQLCKSCHFRQRSLILNNLRCKTLHCPCIVRRYAMLENIGCITTICVKVLSVLQIISYFQVFKQTLSNDNYTFDRSNDDVQVM